jgi:glucose/arabinose dehydrogenase
MKKSYKVVLISVIIVLVILLAIGGFLWKNVSILGLNADKSDIQKNNSSSNEDSIDFQTLINKKVIVPEKFMSGVFAADRTLNLPENFEISVYANGMSSTRSLAFDKNNNIYATDINAGKVYYLPDVDGDSVADDVIEFDRGLKNPHGIVYDEGDLYVAEEGQVVIYKNVNGDIYAEKKVLIPNLPITGGHRTRSLVIGEDKLYVSVGSSCNLCEEKDERIAAVVRYNLDGTGQEIFAKGLRNSVGLYFVQKSGLRSEIWSVDNGRDLLGDDLPPEEVNVQAVDEVGKHFGWPYCYGEQIANPEYSDKSEYCKTQTVSPKYQMQAHSAPLGLTFVNSESFPESLRDNLIVSMHGSWNRTTPTGYKLIRIEDNKNINFITGWLQEDGNAWGRPVDVKFDRNGKLFITDDKAGAIYVVQYKSGG